MHRITNKKAKTEILDSLKELREKHPEINWDNPTGDLVEAFMHRAIMMGLPDVLCTPSTYSTEKGISIQLDHQAKWGLVEHFQTSQFGISMRSHITKELIGTFRI